jgi:hypothetical protein
MVTINSSIQQTATTEMHPQRKKIQTKQGSHSTLEATKITAETNLKTFDTKGQSRTCLLIYKQTFEIPNKIQQKHFERQAVQ